MNRPVAAPQRMPAREDEDAGDDGENARARKQIHCFVEERDRDDARQQRPGAARDRIHDAVVSELIAALQRE